MSLPRVRVSVRRAGWETTQTAWKHTAGHTAHTTTPLVVIITPLRPLTPLCLCLPLPVPQTQTCGRPASAGVLLQGLHISGCSGSAVRVSGGLRPSQGLLQWSSLPAGLHLLDTSLSGNAAGVGGALRAERAAVYLDAVELSDNQASVGGAVSVNQGLLVALRSTFKANSAGSGQM